MRMTKFTGVYGDKFVIRLKTLDFEPSRMEKITNKLA
jgi:hypothetical protein